MQYHCVSLSKMRNTDVSFIGYGGEPCTRGVEENRRVTKIELSTPFQGCSRKLWFAWAPLKVLFQVFQLFWVLLCTIRRPRAVLVQNPPSIPVLLVARLATWLRCSQLVIDWHNFGFSILSHSLGDSHPIVYISYAYERVLGWLGDAHFCVTAAMRDWLLLNWGIRARVLHDKAPSFFCKSDTTTKHELFTRLHRELVHQPDVETLLARVPALPVESGACTLLTTMAPAAGRGIQSTTEEVRERRDRPAVILSSTSWTPDEDFSILLDALITVDAAIAGNPTRYPPMLVLVTGKGPQKEMYQKRIAGLGLRYVFIRTLWLEASDYPRIVGSADLGVSLHVSTSGLDLPMKVVDMFGAGVPVCAVGFPCLGELVRHGDNGLVFASARELSHQILDLFEGWPARLSGGLKTAARNLDPASGLSDLAVRLLTEASAATEPERHAATKEAAADALRGGASLIELLAAGVRRSREEDWESNWRREARPVFQT